MFSALTMLRATKARHFGANDEVAQRSFVRAKSWSDKDEVLDYLKAASPGVEVADVGGGLPLDFLREIARQSVVGRLPGIRTVPALTRLLTPSGAVFASVVPESKAVPMIVGGFLAQQIVPFKVAALTVASNEALAADAVEEGIASDLLAACANAVDTAFLVGTGSIVDGVAPVGTGITTLSGLDAALKAAMVAMTGSLRTSAMGNAELAGR